MSRFKLSRITSLLLRATLLTGLVSFGHGAAFAEGSNSDIANIVQPPPPRALIETQQPPAPSAPSALSGPEQRVALVIGNSNYRNAPQLANPDNDAQSMAQFLNSAGFEVVEATDLTQNDMIKVVQDFSARVQAHGPNTVAMVYYAGHGVQLAGENYLVPVDAKVSSAGDLVGDSVRLVDVMATLEAIPSRMRIVILDACRNNPFPTINDAGRGLAIVDAPNGSIVGYSTAPGSEALDGNGGHSPYTAAFLNLAREPNVPIEQLFKRIRLDVAHATDGAQTPWESSSLTSDFYFFGDTAVAATHPPVRGPVVQMASNLPTRSVRQAYDFVISEGSPQYYQEFIQLFPDDPLCVRIRWLLANLVDAAAWHQAVMLNSPLAYKAFYDSHVNSPYALAALHLQSQPKMLPLTQASHLILPPHPVSPVMPLSNKVEGDVHQQNGKILTLPTPNNGTSPSNGTTGGKIVTLPVKTIDNVNHDLPKDRLDVIKNNGTINHTVELSHTKPEFHPVRHEDSVVKFKSEPVTVNRFNGNMQPTRPIGNIPHIAAFGGGGAMGGGHRGFMR
ncbi:MAG TPA: caspase family protein [Bradyrhizobium sp.]|nr:caspase family protein [Bradyrhizobium sp.]